MNRIDWYVMIFCRDRSIWYQNWTCIANTNQCGWEHLYSFDRRVGLNGPIGKNNIQRCWIKHLIFQSKKFEKPKDGFPCTYTSPFFFFLWNGKNDINTWPQPQVCNTINTWFNGRKISGSTLQLGEREREGREGEKIREIKIF